MMMTTAYVRKLCFENIISPVKRINEKRLGHEIEQTCASELLALQDKWGDDGDLDLTVESPNYADFEVPRSGKGKGELVGCVIGD